MYISMTTYINIYRVNGFKNKDFLYFTKQSYKSSL